VTARNYGNRFAPFATKQNFFAFFNPLMRVTSPHSVVRRRLVCPFFPKPPRANPVVKNKVICLTIKTPGGSSHYAQF
jgi:hypothetical protein